MHTPDAAIEAMAQTIARWVTDRLRNGPGPLRPPPPAADFASLVGSTVTEDGIGADEAFRVFTDVLAPACLATDHPRFLSFIPGAPTAAASLFEAVLGVSAIFGGSWIEGSGAVHAENETLRWLADLTGFPDSAGGVFVSGGSAGNLSALVVARTRWRARQPSGRGYRPVLICSEEAHASVHKAAEILDVDVHALPAGAEGRLDRAVLRSFAETIDETTRAATFAVVATAGLPNTGTVDDLAAAADLAVACDAWFHVDGAYGAAAMLSPRTRSLFLGIERADSVIVDPHKWLFAPYDVCALIYRDPELARHVHTQHAEYLDPILLDDSGVNPSDLAYHLTRRARGLPLWFSLATHGTAAYRQTIERTLDLTARAADMIRDSGHLEVVVEPQLSVVLFRRRGWSSVDYYTWSDEALRGGTAFLLPSEWRGETVFRCCFVNPRTTEDDLNVVFESMA
ncbi:MAG: pyridoxal phosphate-dependent decarboxylase family protein [Acidimicrobiales bacterium]